MTAPQLAKLESATLREAWANESLHFTPWLLENLDELSTAIGIPLEPEGSEVAVDTFYADIIARNPQDDTRVLIENQLECSDHDHLGKILTYLAGLEAHTIVWVASEFRDAHLSAIKWLNESTDDRFAFFAVQLKVVRIAGSPLAPVFDVIERPNDWERRLHAVAPRSGPLTQHGQRALAYWTRYMELHPQEAERSGDANAALSRWRTVPGLNLKLSLFVARDHVGVIIRGPHGVSAEQTMARLEPHWQRLLAALGPDAAVDDRGFLGSRRFGDPHDAAQRDALIDWHFETANRYEAALADALAEEA